MQNGKLYLSQDEVIVFLWLHEEIKITCRESQAAAAKEKEKERKKISKLRRRRRKKRKEED